MQFVSISDLHIKKSGDEASKLFLHFCNHEFTKNSDRVYFLGDIFELLIGDHYSYTKKYAFFFEEIVKLLDSGKEVIFLEGNHDFHFKKIAYKYFKKHTENWSKFRYEKHGEIFETSGKKLFICHGYEVDYYNQYFKNWYEIYTSKWMYILSTYILPFFIINFLGNLASKDSKRRGKKTFDFMKMKEKYLIGAKALIEEKSIDGVICGHTHIEEEQFFENQTIYFNNGFPIKHKRAIIVRDGKPELFSLT